MSRYDELDYLFEEYKYRHELIWRVLFKVTFAVVVLSYLPYIPYHSSSLARTFGPVIVVLPLLAVSIAIASLKVVRNELDLFERVLIPYHAAQDRFFKDNFNDLFFTQIQPFTFDKQNDNFFRYVSKFLWALSLLSMANLLFVAYYLISAECGLGFSWISYS